MPNYIANIIGFMSYRHNQIENREKPDILGSFQTKSRSSQSFKVNKSQRPDQDEVKKSKKHDKDKEDPE